MKITGFCQIYNELEKNNLKRFAKYIIPLVDDLVVYDDGSTDGSFEYMKNYADYIIRNEVNDFKNELYHRQKLLNLVLDKLKPDFILWLDVDEVLSGSREDLESACEECIKEDFDGMKLKELNIWRSNIWRRLDNCYGDGWFTRLWRVKEGLRYVDQTEGLHKKGYPDGIVKIGKTNKVSVLHYGFSSELNLAFKYLIYKSHGQIGWELDRLLDENTLETEKIFKNMFPKDLWVENDPKPVIKTWDEALEYVEKYKPVIFKG